MADTGVGEGTYEVALIQALQLSTLSVRAFGTADVRRLLMLVQGVLDLPRVVYTSATAELMVEVLSVLLKAEYHVVNRAQAELSSIDRIPRTIERLQAAFVRDLGQPFRVASKDNSTCAFLPCEWSSASFHGFA